MKPLSSTHVPSQSGHKNKGPQPAGSEQQALAEKAVVDVNYPDRSATTILAGGSGE